MPHQFAWSGKQRKFSLPLRLHQFVCLLLFSSHRKIAAKNIVVFKPASELTALDTVRFYRKYATKQESPGVSDRPPYNRKTKSLPQASQIGRRDNWDTDLLSNDLRSIAAWMLCYCAARKSVCVVKIVKSAGNYEPGLDASCFMNDYKSFLRDQMMMK